MDSIKLYNQCIPLDPKYFDNEFCATIPNLNEINNTSDVEDIDSKFNFSKDCKIIENIEECKRLNCIRSKLIIELFKTYGNLTDENRCVADWGVAVSPGSRNWNSDDDITILMTPNSQNLEQLIDIWPEEFMSKRLDCNLYTEPSLIPGPIKESFESLGKYYSTDIENIYLFIPRYDLNSFIKELKTIENKENKINNPRGDIEKQFRLCNEVWKNINEGKIDDAWDNILLQRQSKDAAYQTNSAYLCVVIGNQMKIKLNEIENYGLMYLIAALENMLDFMSHLNNCKLILTENTSIECYKDLLKNSKYILRIFLQLKECINNDLLNITDIMKETCIIESCIEKIQSIVNNREKDIDNNLKSLILNNLSEILKCLNTDNSRAPVVPEGEPPEPEAADQVNANLQNIDEIFMDLYKKVKTICLKIASHEGGGRKKRRKRRKTKRKKSKSVKSKRKKLKKKKSKR